MEKKQSELITVSCPCCQAELQIDPVTRAVISHKEHEKPRSMADLEAAVNRFKGEAFDPDAPPPKRDIDWD